MKNLNANEITEQLSKGKIVLEIYSTGCLNCQIMTPILNNLEKDFTQIKFYQINADKFPILLQKYKITSLPTLLLFRYGQFLTSIVGVKHPQLLKRIIDQTLNYA